MIVIVMGVTGAGKTTVGRLLATELGAEFIDADDYHPPANVAKMRSGTPLDDTDRAPWLARLNAMLGERESAGRGVVLACSPLKAAYRCKLVEGLTKVRLVHLTGSESLLRERLDARHGHYMNPRLLDSQLATLEEPGDAITIDIFQSPAEMVRAIRSALSEGAG
jgi:gluconokinase